MNGRWSSLLIDSEVLKIINFIRYESEMSIRKGVRMEDDDEEPKVFKRIGNYLFTLRVRCGS